MSDTTVSDAEFRKAMRKVPKIGDPEKDRKWEEEVLRPQMQAKKELRAWQASQSCRSGNLWDWAIILAVACLIFAGLWWFLGSVNDTYRDPYADMSRTTPILVTDPATGRQTVEQIPLFPDRPYVSRPSLDKIRLVLIVPVVLLFVIIARSRLRV